MGFFSKGIILQQNKEPALSRPLREFFNAGTTGVAIEAPPIADKENVTPEQLIELAKRAKIIDENDGSQLFQKLISLRKKHVTALVADAVDDEPYVSSQLSCMLFLPDEAIGGLKLVARALGAKKVAIAVYKNINDLSAKIPRTIHSVPVRRITGRYPVQYRIRDLFPEEKQVAVIGSGALIHLYRALVQNIQQTTCFVTVAGNCIGNPTNLEVSIGMTASQLLERCGLVKNPSRVIIGGPMTGVSVIDAENTQITATTRALLAFQEDVKDQQYKCIGCGRCIQVCPENLSPTYLYAMHEKKRYQDLSLYDPQRCIGCATCSYICPSKLDLAQAVQRLKRIYQQSLHQEMEDVR